MVARSTSRKNVRILLVGERGVGKTSLILSLVSEEFPEYVPAKAEEITIPADVTPEQVPTNIVDYSTVEQSEENLTEEIQKADVICVVYAMDDDETLDQITNYWLPMIREHRDMQRCPIVLVGNKIDLVEYSNIDEVLNMMEDYPEIESCVGCSAKTLQNISEVFYYAQKAVLHPTTPLYIAEIQDLTEKCKEALIRIFKICDIDCDGLLNDMELNNFQRCCFNAPLQPQVLDDVKAVLRRNVEDGICQNAVTLKGFLYLHNLFIQRGRNETTWTVLRKFGYNDSLLMSKDYIHPHIKVPSGSTAELSHKGSQFLSHLFERFDKDKDGALSTKEIEEMFSICPSIPWGTDVTTSVVCNENGWITYQGFMCKWHMLTFTELQKTLEYFAYLGYNIYENESQISAVQVTREKKLDLAKKQSSRNVYMCHIIGSHYCGKSSFARSFIKQGFSKLPSTPELGGIPVPVVNVVQVYGQEKILILKEIEIENISDPLMPHQVQCDVAVLLYDISDPKSFEFVARMFIKYFAESKIPVLVVANKGDLLEVKQDYLMQPATFCTKYAILPPHPFSSTGHIRKDVYVKLATMAAYPPLRRMVHMLFLRPKPSEWFNSFCRHMRVFGLTSDDPLVWWKAGLSLMAATAFGFIVVRVLQNEKVK